MVKMIMIVFALFLTAACLQVNLYAEDGYEFPHALSLEGDGTYIDFGVDAGDLGIEGNKEKTIEIQVFMRSFQDSEGIFSLGETGADLRDFSLRARGRENRFRGQFWGQDVDFSYDAKNKWVHFAVTHDGETHRIYADGELVGEQNRELDTSEEQNLRIGFWRNTDRGTLDGMTKELRVWNIARSEGEIRDNMEKTLTGDEEGLVGYWPLTEGEGDTVYDKTANENHVEINGAVWSMNIIPAELAEEPTERVLPALTDVVRGPESIDLYSRKQAVRALAMLDVDYEEVQPLLLDILKDTDETDEFRLVIMDVLLQQVTR